MSDRSQESYPGEAALQELYGCLVYLAGQTAAVKVWAGRDRPSKEQIPGAMAEATLICLRLKEALNAHSAAVNGNRNPRSPVTYKQLKALLAGWLKVLADELEAIPVEEPK